ncbi:MAG: DUF2812 domain-containing protein [Oscillospiraceae bacterium]|nr:DUF2812 domain-containing protein [Oscillospiraceae bacterium]
MSETLIRFFTIADYEEEEIWLRERHKSGMKLVKMIPPCFYIFEECEPRDVIYRLDFKNSEQTEEYMSMLGDFGWEYFAQCFGWLYFRKPADEAETEAEGELFCDSASRSEMAAKIVKTRLLPLACIFLCCVLPNLSNAVSGRLGAFSGFFKVFFGVMFAIYVYLILHCGIKLRKIREKNR